MAEQELTQPAPDVNERPTTHAKRAQIVALILIVVVFLGLFVQTWINMSGRSERHARQEEEALLREAQARPREATSLNDFAVAQKQAEAEIRARTAKQVEDDKRKALLEGVAHRPAGGLAKASHLAGREFESEITPASVRHDFAMDELKRALEASRGKIGVSSKRGQNTLAQAEQALEATSGGESELARVNAEVARLRAVPEQVARSNRELIAKAESLGINLPPELLARAGAVGASRGSRTGAGMMPVSAPASAPGLRPTGGLAGLSFGELAQNRVEREPGNAGPRPGEEIIPTGTVISGVLDMDMMSDYGGNWKGVLQRPVYDTRLEHILLPAGTKIIGKSFRVSLVNEAIQNRMGATPLWAIRPDGRRIDFRRTAGVDAAGVAALQDLVDRHVLAQLFGVGAYALIGLGPSTQTYGAEPDSAPDAAVREATAQARAIGRNFAEKYLSIVPTVTIRAGTPIKIFVEDDIYVTPWAPIDSAHFAAAR